MGDFWGAYVDGNAPAACKISIDSEWEVLYNDWWY